MTEAARQQSTAPQPFLREAVVASPVASGLSLDVQGLTKQFADDRLPIFRDISLQVPQGESLALIGPNGTGKSTFLRCCLRLIEPDSGTIHLQGQCITSIRGRRLRQARRSAAVVFQKHNLVPRLSVLSNIIHGSLSEHRGPRYWLQSLAREEIREKAFHCLELVGLPHLADKRCDQLSGGQSQRVAIARALMQDPKLLIADEPTASLDPQAGHDIMALFVQLSRQMNLTLMFVSHDMEHALAYSDRIVGFREQTIALDTAPSRESAGSLAALFR